MTGGANTSDATNAIVPMRSATLANDFGTPTLNWTSETDDDGHSFSILLAPLF